MRDPAYGDLTPTGQPSQPGDWTWEVATFFPRQGKWTEGEYLGIDSRGGRLVELVGGVLQVLPTPTVAHQLIVGHLLSKLSDYVEPRKLGYVLMAPCPIRVSLTDFREPDVFFATRSRIRDLHTPPDGVDLAIEVVSDDPSDRKRDLVEKRIDYAQAGIPEYWIVDPLERRITVLVLEGDQYRVDGEYSPGQTAHSKLLDGFEIDVAAVFAAGESEQ